MVCNLEKYRYILLKWKEEGINPLLPLNQFNQQRDKEIKMKNQLNTLTLNALEQSLYALLREVRNIVVEEATRVAKIDVIPFLATPDTAESEARAINLFSLKIQADNATAIVKEAVFLQGILGDIAKSIGAEPPTLIGEVVVPTETEEVMVLFRRHAKRIRLAVEEVLKECNKDTFGKLVDNLHQILHLVRLLCTSITTNEVCDFDTTIKCHSLLAILRGIYEWPQ